MLLSLILTLHVLVAIAVVVLVLVQHGKGADMGAAFGTGSAGSLFGSSGAASFLSRSTAVCAAIFFVTSLGLTYYHTPRDEGVTTGIGKSVTSQPDAKKGAADAIPSPTAPTSTGGDKTATPAVPATGDAAKQPVKPASEQIPK